MERWRRPAVILDHEPDPHRVILNEDGRIQRDERLTVDRDTAERFRLGYLCIICHEPQEQAFPERCSLCGFEMRERQGGWIRAHFLGSEIVGSKVRMADELEQLGRDDD